ncbi:hypothetical protein DTO002I6_8948 [Penicillium roqueforti]|nr:hypothetical protein DTO002I6_8948 [Penicillium roqueforti]
MARVTAELRINMSPSHEGPIWAALGIDMATNTQDRLATQHLIKEIYNPILYNALQQGRPWNGTFRGHCGFEVRRRITARQHELPAVVLAHVPDSAELTERIFDVLRFYRFTDPTWRVTDPNYPIFEVFSLPAPAGGLAPRPGPGFSLLPAPTPAHAPAPTPARLTRARARARALVPSPAPVPVPVLAPVPTSGHTFTPVRTRNRTIFPVASPNPVPAPVFPVSPVPKAATKDTFWASGGYHSPYPPAAPFIQPSIDPPPDSRLLVAPEDIHSPIPDDFYTADTTEAPSPPRTEFGISTSTIEQGKRKRTSDDEKDGETSPPQKKRSKASRLPKEKVEWSTFTTLSDSSSNDEEILDADGDAWMGESFTPYKIKNKSVEPDSSVWSSMRDYFLLKAREPTPDDQDEEHGLEIGE